MAGILPNAAAFRSGQHGHEHRPYCAPAAYEDMYCGRSGTHFPMYCASSSGVLKHAPGHPKKRQGGPSGEVYGDPKECPAKEPCCEGAGLAPTFVLTPDGCCSRPCAPLPPRDHDVPRRIGGFTRSMPSPTCWI